MNRTVVLVDDDPKARAALSHMLLREGMELVSCHDAEQALDVIPKDGRGPDVAILDVRLPGLQGDQLGKRLREEHPETRIIFVTDEPNAVSWLPRRVPGCMVMPKPVDPSGLIQLIA